MIYLLDYQTKSLHVTWSVTVCCVCFCERIKLKYCSGELKTEIMRGFGNMARLFGLGGRRRRGMGMGGGMGGGIGGGMGGGMGGGRGMGMGGGGPMAREGGDVDAEWMLPFMLILLVIGLVILKIVLDRGKKRRSGESASTSGSGWTMPNFFGAGRTVGGSTSPSAQRLGTAQERGMSPNAARRHMHPDRPLGQQPRGSGSNSLYPSLDRDMTPGTLYPSVDETPLRQQQDAPTGRQRQQPAAPQTTVLGPPDDTSSSQASGPRLRRKFAQLEALSAKKKNDYGMDYVDPTGSGKLPAHDPLDAYAPTGSSYRVLGPPGEDDDEDNGNNAQQSGRRSRGASQQSSVSSRTESEDHFDKGQPVQSRDAHSNEPTTSISRVATAPPDDSEDERSRRSSVGSQPDMDPDPNLK